MMETFKSIGFVIFSPIIGIGWLAKQAFVVKGRRLREVYLYRFLFLAVMWLITFGTLTIGDQWNMPIERSEAQVISKNITTRQHYQIVVNPDGSTSRIPTHTTLHYNVKVQVDTEDGVFKSWKEISKAYYDDVKRNQIVKVSFKRGKWRKPFGQYEWFNWIFGFGGVPKLYVKQVW